MAENQISYEDVLKDEGLTENELPTETKQIIKKLKDTVRLPSCKDKDGNLKEGVKLSVKVYNKEIIRQIYEYVEEKEGKNNPTIPAADIVNAQEEEQKRLAALEANKNNPPAPPKDEPKKEESIFGKLFGR